MSDQKKRILLVDDEPAFTRMVKLNLEQSGKYEVMEENRATMAIHAAKAFKPDLILLDVVMPAMDGGDIAAKIQADKALRDVPIVFLTAIVEKKEAKVGGMRSGGLLFLAKPVSLETLVKTIEENVRR
jgi:two-component system, OmpR family, response regulator